MVSFTGETHSILREYPLKEEFIVFVWLTDECKKERLFQKEQQSSIAYWQNMIAVAAEEYSEPQYADYLKALEERLKLVTETTNSEELYEVESWTIPQAPKKR